MPKEKFLRHAGDCNEIARDRSSNRSGAPTKQYTSNYDQINWNSKKDKK